MLLKEMLNLEQLQNILNGVPDGIFPALFDQGSPYYQYSGEMCLDYYLTHSGEKKVSRVYTNLILALNETVDNHPTADSRIGTIINNRFRKKWDKIYYALFESSYDPLEQIDLVESRNATNAEIKTFDNVVSRTGTNVDQVEYNSTTQDNSNTGVNETVTRDNSVEDNVYGFNSSVAVGDTTEETTGTTTTVADFESNRTVSNRIKGGDDTTTHTLDNSESKSGTDRIDYEFDDETQTRGRKVAGAELVQQELDMRNKNILFDIIFRDIDSVITLAIY